MPDPEAPDGLRVELQGDLATILRLGVHGGDAAAQQRKTPRNVCSGESTIGGCGDRI